MGMGKNKHGEGQQTTSSNPIPLPASPLKGEENTTVSFMRLPWLGGVRYDSISGDMAEFARHIMTRCIATMAFRTSWEGNRFFAEFSGDVPATEISAVNHEFTGDSRFDSVRSAIWDMSRISQLTMPRNDIEYAAAIDIGAAVVRPSLMGAIIVREGHVKELVEEYLAVTRETDHSWDTRIFDNLNAAEKWLNSCET